jgi:hypothetical protein
MKIFVSTRSQLSKIVDVLPQSVSEHPYNTRLLPVGKFWTDFFRPLSDSICTIPGGFFSL